MGNEQWTEEVWLEPQIVTVFFKKATFLEAPIAQQWIQMKKARWCCDPQEE